VRDGVAEAERGRYAAFVLELDTQFRPVPRAPSFFSIKTFVSFDRPMPSGN